MKTNNSLTIDSPGGAQHVVGTRATVLEALRPAPDQ